MTIQKSDINPETGKAYAVNPRSGVWDDNYWALEVEPRLKAQGINIPAFNFDYDQAEKEARAKLEPYYKQKLDEANGDVARAKQLIEQDYERGLRTAREDTAVALNTDTQNVKEENLTLGDSLNKRGVMFSEAPAGDPAGGMVRSGLAGTEFGALGTKQDARRQAIERALSRQEEVAGVERKRGIEEQDIQQPRYARALKEEQEKRIQTEFVPMARERARTKYDETYAATLNPYLQR